MGLISVLEALLDTNSEVIFNTLPLNNQMIIALEKKEGKLGAILKMCITFEQGNLQEMYTLGKSLDYSQQFINEKYTNALIYADNTLVALD